MIALFHARKHSNEALSLLKSITEELGRMMEMPGQPKYERLYHLFALFVIEITEVGKYQGEMKSLMAQGGKPISEEVLERMAIMEARLAELQAALGVRLS